jgi:hypothetical protein
VIAQGTVRFTPDHPLRASLVRELVRARSRQSAARRKAAG